MKIDLPQRNYCKDIINDSNIIERIINVDDENYYYIKYKNNYVIVSGPLRSYKISNIFYLFREGPWILEDSIEVVEFKNLAKIGLLDEIKIDQNRSQINDSSIRKKGKKKRRMQKTEISD
jgi:hypothetical protein